MAPQSCSSSFHYRFTYDVFLSFRGSDTRHGFTGHLYKYLSQKGIHTFIDDEELQGGDEITPALAKAIQESRIAIPVFSIDYASSSFCLDELANIIDCIHAKGRLVLPVFYNIDPSHVRHQIGTYGEALAKHEDRFKNNKEKLKNNMERLHKWKTSLNQVANLSGYHYKHGDEYEHEFIENIVEEVSRKIDRVPLPVADYPVGLESRVLQVISLLDVGFDEEVHMVGIHGMGGIGKTTLALAVYNSIADHFQGLCFLENVRENSEKHGLQHLQSILLHETVGKKEIELTSVKKGMSIIQHRLQAKKVLLIIDDVDKPEQLQAIVGRHDWFGPGSRVIITTRDQQLLAQHGVKRTYEVEELNRKDALQLFRWMAFKSEEVDASYVDLLNDAVTYASGLPLALEIVGCNLYGKSTKAWTSAINQYKRIPNTKIQEIFKISFDALEEEEKSVFLDIACFFKGYTLAEVEDILHAHHGDSMKHHIQVLVDKSLIKIIRLYKVTLHDLIEEMGKEIVRQESPKEPGKRSRLWFYKDIVQVLEHNEGTREIEIIYLRFPLFGEEENQVQWNGEAFKKMKNLKTLIIRNGHFSKGPEHLPNGLRVLEWWKYPAQDFPEDFHPEKLAICKFPDSCFSSANFIMKEEFASLTILNFSRCKYLRKIPDFSCLPNLENLSFDSCENLSMIHHSVGLLDKLKILDVGFCSRLWNFPPIKLTSLENFYLWGSRLGSFPEVLGKMENLKKLSLDECLIRSPHSFRNLVGLQNLEMEVRRMLTNSDADNFLESIATMPNLTVVVCSDEIIDLYYRLSKEIDGEGKVTSCCIQFDYCQLTDNFFPAVVTYFANVKILSLVGNNFVSVPECIKQCHFLKNLDLSLCYHLQEVRGLPPNLEDFMAIDCKSLTWSCRRMLLDQELHKVKNTKFYLPGKKIPNWFEHRIKGSSIPFCFHNKNTKFHLPGTEIPNRFKHRIKGSSISFWFRNKIPALLFCFVQKECWPSSPYKLRMLLFINGKKYYSETVNDNHTYLISFRKIAFEFRASRLKKKWNYVELTSSCGAFYIYSMEIGIHVLEQECSMEDIQFCNPYRVRKLNDDLNSIESPIQQLRKPQRIEDVKVPESQFVYQEDGSDLWSCTWTRTCDGCSSFPIPSKEPMDDTEDDTENDTEDDTENDTEDDTENVDSD